MGELSEIAYIRVGEATVDEEAGNISVLWSWERRIGRHGIRARFPAALGLVSGQNWVVPSKGCELDAWIDGGGVGYVRIMCGNL